MSNYSEANISFSGCGFIGIYHVGVSICLQKYAPGLLRGKIGGSSAGAMCALALTSGVSLVEVTRLVALLASEANKHKLGPLSPRFSLHQKLKDNFDQLLPEDVVEKINGRCFISITKAIDNNKGLLPNLLISQFHSKDDIVEAVCVSSFIPMVSGWMYPKFRGEVAIDGGYSDNIPDLGGNTITVSPFSGDASICPPDDTSSPFSLLQPSSRSSFVNISSTNVKSLKNAIFPPNSRILKDICSQGFKDAMRFLQSEKLLKCDTCLQVEGGEENKQLLTSCSLCLSLNDNVKSAKLPSEILEVFESMETEYNK